MSTKHPLTLDELRTFRQDGGLEITTHDSVLQPGRHTFADLNDLTAHLSKALGGRPAEGGGIGGSVARGGTYSRRAANGTQAVTFGDAVLDAISSASGTLVIGNETIDLRKGVVLPDAPTGASGVVPFDAPALKFTGMVNGAERWAANDESEVEFRIGTGRLNFHAWKKDTFFGYWSMGGEIGITGTDVHFEAAQAMSLTYMTVPGQDPCKSFHTWFISSAANDKYVDSYDWGWNSQQPERVLAVCQAVWHNAIFREAVTAGVGCLRYRTESLPGIPTEWHTLKTIMELGGSWTDGSPQTADIAVRFNALAIDMSAFNRPGATGTVVNGSTITATFPDDKAYTGTLQPPRTIHWSNGSSWTKIFTTAIDLNGRWTDGSPLSAVIHQGSSSLTIDMSDFDRPGAHGSVVNSSTITATFPDDKTYTGTLQPPGTIRWSNGSAWTRV